MPEIRLQDYVVKIKEMIRSVRLDESIAHCQHILRHYPKHIETYCLLGEACLEKEMYREAIEFFQRTLGADPENLMARVGLAVIYDEQGAYPEAIWQLERAFELAPGNAEVRRELLRLYGQYDEIDKTRLKLTRGALGRLYSRNGLYERAIGEFRAVLRQDPDLPDTRVALVEALWREGRQLEAVEMCIELLDALPNCLKANLILGDIWLRGGNEESAGQRLSVARALDPENIVAQELMGTDSPLPPEEVRIPELDAVPDEFEFAPSDVSSALVVAGAAEIIVAGAPDEEEPWGTDEELPEWLRDVGVTAEEEPPLEMVSEQEVLEPPPDEALPTEEMPEWLQEVMGEEGLPPAGEPVTVEGEPFDGEFTGDEEAPDLEEAAAAAPGVGLAGGAAVAAGLVAAAMLDEEDEEPPEAEMPGEEIPEWLEEIVAEGAPPLDEEPEPEGEIVAPLVAEVEGDLALEEAAPPVAEVEEEELALEEAALPVAEVEEEELALAEAASLAEEIPDWLRDLDTAEEVAAPPAAEVEEEAPELEEAALPAEEIPDWLRDLDAAEAEEVGEPLVAEVEMDESAAPPVVEVEEAPSVEEEVPLIDEIPDWLRDLDAPQVEEAAAPPAAEIGVAGQEGAVPASLLALVAAGLLDESDLESAMAEMSDEELAAQREEEIPDWLSELVEEEPVAAEAEIAFDTPSIQEAVAPVSEIPVAEEASIEEAVELEAELVVEEAVLEVAKPEPVVEEAVLEVAEPEPVVEEAVLEVAEPEPVVEEAVLEAVEPEPVIEEAVLEAVEPQAVAEEAVLEAVEPEPELVVEEAVLEIVEPEPELVVEEAVLEVAEPEPELVVEEAVLEAVEPEPEPVVEEAVLEVVDEEFEAPSRADDLLLQLKTRPRDYSARLELARLYYDEEDWDGALANYERLISARRFLPDIVDDLESLVEKDVEPARVYHMLGDAYMQQDQLDEALEMYRLARQKLTKR